MRGEYLTEVISIVTPSDAGVILTLDGRRRLNKVIRRLAN